MVLYWVDLKTVTNAPTSVGLLSLQSCTFGSVSQDSEELQKEDEDGKEDNNNKENQKEERRRGKGGEIVEIRRSQIVYTFGQKHYLWHMIFSPKHSLISVQLL